MSSALKLADHFWSHPIFVSFHLKVCVKATETVSVLLNLNLFQPFFYDGRTDEWEELANVLEAHDFVLLQESGSVGLRLLLDEMSEMAGLRIVYFTLRLDLANSVKGVQLSDYDSALVVALFDHTAIEIIVCGGHSVIKNWRIVHIVFKHGESFVSLLVNLTEKVELLEPLLEHEFSIRSYVAIGHILMLLIQELFLCWLFITVVIAFQTTSHSEVIDKKRMLIDVLEDAELSLCQRKLEAGLKVEMWV